MLKLVVSQALPIPPTVESMTLPERLDDLAREMEAAGLPWAAARLRGVLETIAAERSVAEAFRR